MRGPDYRRLMDHPEAEAALAEVAARTPAPIEAVRHAIALAARYETPQRAIYCGLVARRAVALAARLRREGRCDELLALEACSSFSSYAKFLVAPLPPFEMGDELFANMMRVHMCLPILDPKSLRCVTVAGREGKSARCPLRPFDGMAREQLARLHPGLADRHAVTCKCGGHPIRIHNRVVAGNASRLTDWGAPIQTETAALLVGGELRMDTLHARAGRNHGHMAVDTTRRHGGDFELLRQAEEAKVRKYTDKYMGDVLVRGFAFNQFYQLGPQAREVVERYAAAAEREGQGDRDELRLDLLAWGGRAVAEGHALAFARVARNNGVAHGPAR